MAAPLCNMFPLQSADYFKVPPESDTICTQNFLHDLVNEQLFTAISGKDETLMTSLLQQAAVSYSSQGMKTVFIKPRPHYFLPQPVHGMLNMTYATVQLIEYRYMDKVEQLIDYLLSIDNSQHSLPQALIIDEMDAYVRQLNCASELAISRLCSIILDSLKYLKARYGRSVPLLISVSDTLHNHLQAYASYIPVTLLLTKDGFKDETSFYSLTQVATQSNNDNLMELKLSQTSKSISIEKLFIAAKIT